MFHSDSGLSPLEKYDLYEWKVHGKKTLAATFEQAHLYQPDANSWEGLCNAWSAASLLEAEPTHEATLDGITFTVADQKALLLKTYESVDGEREFGQRFNGLHGDDFDDIYPDQFHRFLQAVLFERESGFVFDRDPGIQVWNQPVYRAFINIQADPHDSGVLHVETWLTWADDLTAKPDTLGPIPVNSRYTYDLYGRLQPDGSFFVDSGEWTGHSLDDHPDFVTLLPQPGAPHRSNNPEIKTETVQEILTRAIAENRAK